MFKQVFSKLFRSEDSNLSTKNKIYKNQNNNNQAAINQSQTNTTSTIPTISSCFQINNFNNLNESGSSSQQQLSKCSSNINISTNKNITNCIAKFNESSTRQIYIAPHCIKYSNSTLDSSVSYRIDDDSLNDIALEILESDNLPPKLQIVFYDGKYFAINNSHLQIYKQLQLSGLITHVQADLISVEAIPYAIRQSLLQSNNQSNLNYSDNENEIENSIEEIDLDSFNINNNDIRTNLIKTECSSSSGFSSINNSTTSSNLNANINTVAGILSADVLTPASIELLTKEMLVDETYEFGNCDNCLESEDDHDDDNELDNNDQDDEDDDFEQRNLQNLKIKSQKKIEKTKNQKEQEIINTIKKDFEWKNYEKFCSSSSSSSSLSLSNTQNSKASNRRRRQHSNEDIKENENELDNLLSSSSNQPHEQITTKHEQKY